MCCFTHGVEFLRGQSDWFLQQDMFVGTKGLVDPFLMEAAGIEKRKKEMTTSWNEMRLSLSKRDV